MPGIDALSGSSILVLAVGGGGVGLRVSIFRVFVLSTLFSVCSVGKVLGSGKGTKQGLGALSGRDAFQLERQFRVLDPFA